MYWPDYRVIRRTVMLGLLLYFIIRYVFPLCGAILNLLVAYLEHIGRALP